MDGAHSRIGRVRSPPDAMPECQPLAACQNTFGDTLADVRFDALGGNGFGSDVRVCRWPEFTALVGFFGSMRLSSTPQRVGNDDLLFVTSQGQRWSTCHNGRKAILGPDDGVLLLGSETWSVTIDTSARLAAFRIACKAARAFSFDPHGAPMRIVCAKNPPLRLLMHYVDAAVEAPTDLDGAVRHMVMTHLCDLLALALRPEGARTRTRAARLQALKADIVANAGPDALSVNAVAARHSLTPRYVQMLFEAEGTTFTQFLLGERLKRAHRRLSDPTKADQSVSSIAYACGFGDLSYFNKVFRRRFGTTPSEVRAAAISDTECLSASATAAGIANQPLASPTATS